MIKRLNFTGRRRIPLHHVNVEVADAPVAGQPRRFDAVINLAGLDLLPHASVVMEAMCAGNSVVSRFPFGTVAAIEPPPDRSLGGLTGEHVFFTLKVVDRSERFGRILGIAENIRPFKAGGQTAVGRRGILPIERVDLGQQLWRLEFKANDVYLLVNSRIPGLAERFGSDPLTYAIVYPQVVREVLSRAILDEEPDIEGSSDRWFDTWARFGTGLHPLRLPPPPGDEEEDDAREWIETVVVEFCKSHAMRDRFAAALSNTGQEAL